MVFRGASGWRKGVVGTAVNVDGSMASCEGCDCGNSYFVLEKGVEMRLLRGAGLKYPNTSHQMIFIRHVLVGANVTPRIEQRLRG